MAKLQIFTCWSLSAPTHINKETNMFELQLCLIQWHGDDVELVHADGPMSIATADPMYWETEDFECFSSKLWEGGCRCRK